jgi:hypothetical protein
MLPDRRKNILAFITAASKNDSKMSEQKTSGHEVLVTLVVIAVLIAIFLKILFF